MVKEKSTLSTETSYKLQRTEQTKQRGWGLSLNVNHKRKNKNMFMLYGQALSIKVHRTAQEGKWLTLGQATNLKSSLH